MDVEVAVLADAANMTANGKLNVLGIFNRIFATTYPALHPMMCLVLRLRVDVEEAERSHELAVLLRDADGRVLKTVIGRVAPKRLPAGQFAVANEVISLVGVIFEGPGTYEFQLLWDGNRVSSVPLLMMVAPDSQAEHGPEAPG